MQCLTPIGEALWPFVFTPQEPIDPSKEPQYQLALMYPKDTKAGNAAYKKLRKIIEDVAIAKFGKNAPDRLKSGQLKSPLKDGDDSGKDYTEGHWILQARSTNKPEVVDADLDDIINTREFYGGCKARMDIYFYAFDKAGNKGVAAILNNVQKTGEGERKTGAQSAKDAFDRVESDDEDDEDDELI